MPLRVSVADDRSARLAAPLERVYALVADVPRLAPCFPPLEQLVHRAPDVFEWHLKPMGPPKFALAAVYGCRYTFDAQARTGRWEPVPGIGNALVEGHWRLAPDGDGTRIEVVNAMTLELPLPGFVGPVVTAAVQAAFSDIMAQHMQRIRLAL